jgi:alkylhydroperoxidase family enzyme
MSDIRQARQVLVKRVLEGAGKASPSQRRAAFNLSGIAEPPAIDKVAALVDKVARHAYLVTDEDVAAAKLSGLSEDQVFEIVVCAAIGQATRQYDTAIAALDAIEAPTGKE